VLVASSNFLVPGPTFVVELAIFLVTLWALNKWILPIVNKTMEDRQAVIERSISDAEEAKKRAQELLDQHTKLLEEGRAEARALKDEAVKIGDRLREELRKQGEDEYRRLVERASSDIEASARRAAEELRTQVAGLVMDVVEKVLGEGITLKDQERLVEIAIADIERQAAATGAELGPGGAVRTGAGG
jgi:F-type H+-transporting ATPase subunit b